MSAYFCPSCSESYSPENARTAGYRCPNGDGAYLIQATHFPTQYVSRPTQSRIPTQFARYWVYWVGSSPRPVQSEARRAGTQWLTFSQRCAVVVPWLWVGGVVLLLMAALLYFSPKRLRSIQTSDLRTPGTPLPRATVAPTQSSFAVVDTPVAEDPRLTTLLPYEEEPAQPRGSEAELTKWWAVLVDRFADGFAFSFASEPEPSASVITYPPARRRSGFQFGGQTLDFGSETAARMQDANMQWVKFQVHIGAPDTEEKIARAHERGFRVLISLLGEPARVTDYDYAHEFAAYAGEVAAAGADAIEIWNEPNLSRDWPAGRISPALYLNLLRPSYQAVKRANPATLVISAGLAPTLMAENLRTDDFWTEVDYTEQLVAMGGLRYLDCLGVHYNVGITAPDVSDAALRGDAAFVYYPRVLEHYARITQNTRPVCFTEFGYLSGEGLADLRSVAPNFGWAAGTTLEQQATWMLRAVEMARADNQVEMLVVWNVDYWHYGADPHAGYAIIRPDGSCPVCDALRQYAVTG